jgi:endonuclease YncB( thermonuclease family)
LNLQLGKTVYLSLLLKLLLLDNKLMNRLSNIQLILITLLLTTQTVFAEPICKIVDGDTFHFCDGQKVRLDGIDTPEKGEPFYWEARRALASLLQTPNIKVFDCRVDTTGKRDACQVFADGKDVQAELVKQGMAWDWPKYSKGRYSKFEQSARESKTGFWVDAQTETLHWAKRHRH